MINDLPIANFLDELAGPSPTPGGGGAAAIMGSMGAALVSMVCNLTLGKKDYAAVETEIRNTLEESERLRAHLTAMVESDAEVFGQVMSAYRMPRESEEQNAERSRAIQSALKAATEVPLACAKACAEVIEMSRVAAEKGNKNVVSDAGVAVLAGHAGLKSAVINVYVNIANIRDETFVHERLSELNAVLTGMDIAAEEIHQEVERRLGILNSK